MKLILQKLTDCIAALDAASNALLELRKRLRYCWASIARQASGELAAFRSAARGEQQAQLLTSWFQQARVQVSSRLMQASKIPSAGLSVW